MKERLKFSIKRILHSESFNNLKSDKLCCREREQGDIWADHGEHCGGLCRICAARCLGAGAGGAAFVKFLLLITLCLHCLAGVLGPGTDCQSRPLMPSPPATEHKLPSGERGEVVTRARLTGGVTRGIMGPEADRGCSGVMGRSHLYYRVCGDHSQLV